MVSESQDQRARRAGERDDDDPHEACSDEVPEADWAEQHAAAEPGLEELSETGGSHPVTTEADPADLADQDTIAYVEDDEV